MDVESKAGQRISPIFLAILGATVICGLLAWKYEMQGTQTARLAMFGFVIGGWIVSLCLHEFAHAVTAYRFGDHSIASRGYLTLNPAKYADLTLSFLIPVIFVLLGGIGLPGGAVWIDRGAISGKLRHSLVSFAGPAVNLVFAILLSVAVSSLYSAEHLIFWGALSYLAFLQFTAAILNLLPVPGLDGFAIWEPYMPRSFVAKVTPIGGYIFLGLIALLWIGPVNKAFFDGVFHITELFGLNTNLIRLGDGGFRFWER